MPLQKVVLKPGVNRENTRYTNEGGWYESDKVRFRQGTPEKIGGWAPVSLYTFTGICRSLWNWVTLAAANLLGVGTSTKFYIQEQSTGQYFDISPVYTQNTLSSPFTTTSGSSIVLVTDASYSPLDGDSVIFTGVTAFNNINIPSTVQYTITVQAAIGIVGAIDGTTLLVTVVEGDGIIFVGGVLSSSGPGFVPGTKIIGYGTGTGKEGTYIVDIPQTTPFGSATFYTYSAIPNSYLIDAVEFATGTGTGGGTPVYATYLLHVGTTTATSGAWGSGAWGNGNWGGSTIDVRSTLAEWSQFNFGQNLLLGPKKGLLYYWNAQTAPYLATPTQISISVASPAICTLINNTTFTLGEGTAIMFETTGYLPTPLVPFTVYYVRYISPTSFNLSSTPSGALITTTVDGSGTITLSARAIPVSSLSGASNVPLTQGLLTVSDASRFTLLFGTNSYGSTVYDPMLIRWSDQESITNWTPAITNQSGEIQLSHGSLIQTYLQARQEILVFTDAAIYSLQYLGPPYVWGTQLLSDNISIVSSNAASYASGVAYWMGQDKFYKYDGRTQTLRCDLRQYIYDDINRDQFSQIFSGTNEGFNEVWWFYCSETSTVINKYVIYNYAEDIWYYGTMARTAWLDTSLRNYPVAATYDATLVYHEYGVDDDTTGNPNPIETSITSSQYDIGDGHNFAFVYRLLPDLTFRGSTTQNPNLFIQLLPLQNSGSGYNDPKSIGGTSADAEQSVAATSTYPVDLDTYTGQINIRVRGRQMSMRVFSNQIGLQWQLGSPRIDIRQDGRRGG